MGTSMFKAGAKLIIDGKPATLLRKLSDDGTWQIEDERSKRITEYSMTQLHSLYLAGNVIFADGFPSVSKKPKPTKLQEVLANEHDWEAAKVRRLYVLAILDQPNSRGNIERAVSDVWSQLKKPETVPGYVTVYRWKTRYLAAGNDIRALFPRNAQKGNTTSRYSTAVENIVNESVQNIYLTLERQTIQETLDQAIAHVDQENALRPESAQLARPTRRLIKRTIDAISEFDRYAARHGRTAAVKRFRSVLAHRITEAPLERAEIDHSPLDLMVIDDNSNLPLGRPYITACIDDNTRCILGLYISFEPPSHFTVSRCLKQVFMPKTELLKQYPAIKNTWDAHGVMRDLVVDNGQEFHSASLENACFSLGIEIHYSPRKTPWFKGKIERFLGTLNRAIAHGTPGSTFSNIFDKEDYDPSKFAIVKYSVLKEIIYTWVVDVYHQKVHRTLGAPPAVTWSRSIQLEDILVPEDPLRLDFILGRSDNRILSHKGIEIFSLNYNSPELTTLRRKLGEKISVEIRVDTSDIGHIIVFSPDKTEAFKVPALQAEYAVGMSEWQHRVCKRFAACELKSYDAAGWLAAKARIRELIENEFLQKKQRTRTKVARYKNMDAVKTPEPQTPTAAIVPEPTAEAAPIVLVTTSSASDNQLPNTPNPHTRLRIKPILRERTPIDLANDNADFRESNDD